MARGVELASAYISLSVSTDGVPREVEKALGKTAPVAEKAGKEAGRKFSSGAGSELRSGNLSKALAKELSAAGDKGSKEMLRSLSAGHQQAEKNLQNVSRNYARALQNSMTGGGQEAARQWEGEFKKALHARDASQAYFDEFHGASISRGERVGNAVGSVIGKAIGGAVLIGVGTAAAAVGTVLTKGFNRLKKIDDAQFKLKALGHTTEGVAEIMKSAEASVKGTAFALDEAASAAASAVAAGVKPGAELTEYLTTISDTAAIAGTSFDEMASIFNKVRANGKAYTDDLQMLQDRGVPVMQYLQKQYGVTADEFNKMVQDGKVSSADFARALDQNLGGAAQKMGDSLSGAISNLDAAAGRLGASLINALTGGDAAGTTAESVSKITDKLDDLNVWVKDNGDTIGGWFADTGKAATYFGEAVVATLAGTLRGLHVFANAFGDTLAVMYRGQAAVNRALGRTEIADDLDRRADSLFGWADSLGAAEDQAYDLAKSIGGLREGIEEWKTETQASARFTEQLGSAIGKIAPQNWWGKTIIQAPTAEELERIKAAGFEVKEIPGTKDVELVPKTQKATEELNAWRKTQGANPATIPVGANTNPAQAALDAFIGKAGNAQITLPVNIAPGQFALGAGGTAPAAGGSGGLFGGGGSAAAPGPGALPSSIGGGGGGPGGPTAGFPNAMPGTTQGRLFGSAGSPTGGASKGPESGLQNNTIGIKRAIESAFPQIQSIGGYRQDALKWHPNGLAIDVMIPGAGGLNDPTPPEGKALGDRIYQYVMANKEKFGVDYVMWQEKDHYNHLHINTTGGGYPQKGTFDQGGWLQPGQTLANNQTGKPELILTPEQVKEMAAQGVDPAALLHGSSGGAQPGPAQHAGTGAAPGPSASVRTEGYIPAAAGNTEAVGEGGISNFLDLGESFVHNLIDTGAQAASMAATAAAGAASAGAGAAAGPAASTAIQMGAEALKRGVTYGYDMAGIWGEALVEQAFPFGAPRWLGSANPMAFMPQGIPMGEEKKEPGTMGAAKTAIASWAQPGNPAMAVGTGQEGAQAALSAVKTQPSYQPAPQQAAPATPPVMDPLNPATWLQGAVFDNGGMLQPGHVGINLSNQPEPVLTASDWKTMKSAAMDNTGGSAPGSTYNVYASDVDSAIRELRKKERRQARTHSGRP